MRRHVRDCMAICRDEGLRPLRVRYRGKHPAIMCEEGIVPFASSSSDVRYQHNLRAAARRLVRQQFA